MTTRNEMAAAALGGLLANPELTGSTMGSLARRALAAADALIAEIADTSEAFNDNAGSDTAE